MSARVTSDPGRCDAEHLCSLPSEIGQALLRRNDAFTAEASAKEAQHASQRDSLMKRLTNSIKESSALEKELAQCGLNLEAADSSNRALLAELDTARRDLQKLRLSYLTQVTCLHVPRDVAFQFRPPEAEF